MKRYTLAEYIVYLRSFIGVVKFPEVHVHGTWKPTIANFRAKADPSYYIEAMRRTHMQVNGWSDIAQHATIDPDGYIWEGRSLLIAPASSTNHNDSDNDRIHPYMFEMIGNFDAGCEQLEGEQLKTAVGLTRAVVDYFGSKIVFHREIDTHGKTCPGSGVDKAAFVAKVNENPEEVDEMTAEEKLEFAALREAVAELTKSKDVLKDRVITLEKGASQPTPSWAKEAVAAAVKGGLVDAASANGASYDFYRLITVLYRKKLI